MVTIIYCYIGDTIQVLLVCGLVEMLEYSNFDVFYKPLLHLLKDYVYFSLQFDINKLAGGSKSGICKLATTLRHVYI